MLRQEKSGNPVAYFGQIKKKQDRSSLNFVLRPQKNFCINFDTKMDWASFFGDFFTNSSGHTGWGSDLAKI
jgi:hypothetical protein